MEIFTRNCKVISRIILKLNILFLFFLFSIYVYKSIYIVFILLLCEIMSIDIYDEELCKFTFINVDNLKIKNKKCNNCNYYFKFVGKKIICPKCNRIIVIK